MRRPLHISQHAITRYIERVDRSASRGEARLVMMRLFSEGRARANPRHWMRRDGIRPQPGLLFVYCARQPQLCLLLREGVVLTVITRSMCATPRPPHLQLVERKSSGRPRAETKRWRWDGNLGEAA